MKKSLFTLLLLALVATLTAQQQVIKVAILETIDRMENVDYVNKFELRQDLTFAINNTDGYQGFVRADVDQLLREHDFQRNGMVDDKQIKELGRMAGANYILSTEAVKSGYDEIAITANIYDVTTGFIFKSTPAMRTKTDGESMRNTCKTLAGILLGKSGGGSSSPGTNWSGGGGASTLTIRVGNVSFEMVKVEAGTFTMGCTSEQGGDCHSDESPYHRVTISSDYYIGKYEVTQELWQAVMGNNPSNFKGFDRPVEMVSWNDCVEFCNELSRMTGRRFRLPTEAEWEYAARGGRKSTNAKYSGSSSVANVAWYTDNSGGQTHPVGKLRPNELGIHDMSGNVWEWCSDWYGSYGSGSQTDPYGASSGQDRVLRGGSWRSLARGCRVSNRDDYGPGSRTGNFGFRVVLVP